MLLRQSGVRKSLGQALQMFPALADWSWNQWIADAVNTASRIDVPALLPKVQEASRETEQNASQFEGFFGLMGIMNDPQTQKLLQFAVRLGNKLLSNENTTTRRQPNVRQTGVWPCSTQ